MFFQRFRVLYDISRKIVFKSTLAEDVDIYTYGHFSGYNIVVSCACAATHKNSNAMELESLKRQLKYLDDNNIEVTKLVTDRHTQVSAYMAHQKPEIEHSYDVWHVAKGITIQLSWFNLTIPRTLCK